MKYLLFISYNNGLKHNAVYENLTILHESILQLVEEEELVAEKDGLPTLSELKKHLQNNDDFYKELSNDIWFHIQELSERNHIRDEIPKEISV